MSKASQEFEDCLHVAADALKVSGYSRDNDSGIAQIFLRDPYLVTFLERLNAVRYLELTEEDGTPYRGSWIFLFRNTLVATWHLNSVRYPNKPYVLQLRNEDKTTDEMAFETRDEMFAYMSQFLKEKGIYFLREMWG